MARLLEVYERTPYVRGTAEVEETKFEIFRLH
jgi:hypothetical protein